MKEEKALSHYARLLTLPVKQDVAISQQEIADRLCTSSRHSRTLLQDLAARDWLTWLPKVGRNQRSTLHLRYTLAELKQQLAQVAIEAGRYEKALTLLAGDQRQFCSLLQQTSGVAVREGQLHIQLTYPRVLQPLLPHLPLRNSERFLVRQVYACLTQCDAHGQVQPQLAHHWQCNDEATVWQFFLRPNLTFHSGQPIDAVLIKALLTRLQTLSEYAQELAHVRDMTATRLCLTVTLSSPDKSFAALLSDLRYSIQPPEQVHPECQDNTFQDAVFNSTGQGCGPFQIEEHSERCLRLRAFDQYFALRSLTDSVTIWQFEQPPSERIEFGRREQDRQEASVSSSSVQTRVENGGIFLLFNQGTRLQTDDDSTDVEIPTLSSAQRRYLSRILSPALIQQQGETLTELLRVAVPAYNLLPSWTKIIPSSAWGDEEAIAPLPARMDIAVYDHQVIMDCAQVLSEKLRQLGVASEVHVYTLAALQARATNHQLTEAIVITSLHVDDNLPVSLYRWFCSNTVLRCVLPAAVNDWLDQALSAMRAECEVNGYLPRLESLATTMIAEHWVTPLFHHRQTLCWQGALHGVQMTDWSWPDFKNVWVEG
ncbi:SgrR family transcriptional regulator [Photobacterium aphoticum]|uniref:Transporter n=1 Tax=Photobacterium aphoticum TaxID=754436 RepID=A0A0J1GFX6_9GAMM|nr:SgrR family transcriptional regulator [Photobacterium aphoticum]KLU98470.1 hypothetical protein ABT58_22540 [Photobacterium aphoticum]PSU57414.1 hypothetical protein C9I90_09795 [Photobacterium aphoticum]GHA63508.1 peptide-binding protein [Photobacterium aphoticum]